MLTKKRHLSNTMKISRHFLSKRNKSHQKSLKSDHRCKSYINLKLPTKKRLVAPKLPLTSKIGNSLDTAPNYLIPSLKCFLQSQISKTTIERFPLFIGTLLLIFSHPLQKLCASKQSSLLLGSSRSASCFLPELPNSRTWSSCQLP